jgi:hypothetical protein
MSRGSFLVSSYPKYNQSTRIYTSFLLFLLLFFSVIYQSLFYFLSSTKNGLYFCLKLDDSMDPNEYEYKKYLDFYDYVFQLSN